MSEWGELTMQRCLLLVVLSSSNFGPSLVSYDSNNFQPP